MTPPRSFQQELVSVFGQPVAENPTQYMIEKAFEHHGLPWRYLTIEVPPEKLGDAVRGMRAMGFRGGNLTIPHKVSIIPHLDELGESARLMEAVNTIVVREGKLIGENTDGKGFVQSLRSVTDPRGKQVVMFGAGGAARAMSVELGLAGAGSMTIVNRTEERGRSLVELLKTRVNVEANFIPWRGDFDIPSGTDIVINTTSIGLFPDVDARVPVSIETLQPGMIVADVIPNPPSTRLLRDARARGCTVLDGIGMLVNQGVIAFQLWTGVSPDPQVMHAALREVFGE